MVAHLVWDQRVAGSNPVSPTNKENVLVLYFSLLLLALMGLCFYAGYCFFESRIGNIIEALLVQLEDEKIIRIIEHDGEHEIYSGTKFYVPERNQLT